MSVVFFKRVKGEDTKKRRRGQAEEREQMRESSKFFFLLSFFSNFASSFNSSYLNSRARKDTRGSRFKTFTGGKKRAFRRRKDASLCSLRPFLRQILRSNKV